MNENILKIDSIDKTYKKAKIRANDNITANFKTGEIVALIGHNGAGKSTLLNQIIGITKPDAGDITYLGNSFVKNPKNARNCVSIMPQLHAPLSGVTVSQAITSILRIKGIKKSEINILLSKIIKELEIEEWKDTIGDKLSGGLRRLTSFAMTVASPSNIVLLDEPTNDVDPVRRKLMWQYLRKMSSNGHIIIIVTHNLLEVEQYADRYIMFDKGKLVKDESTHKLHNQFSTNILLIDVNDSELINDKMLPDVISKEILDDNKLALTVSLEQMENTIAWLSQAIKQNKVSNYRLSPTSLEMSYGGMLNDE